jgi:hypothetical protein
VIITHNSYQDISYSIGSAKCSNFITVVIIIELQCFVIASEFLSSDYNKRSNPYRSIVMELITNFAHIDLFGFKECID